MRFFQFLLLCLILNNGFSQENYMTKYAGEYIIKIEGVNTNDIEKYILKPNGECIWKWETGRYPDTKFGRWSAEKGKIKTVNKGKSGDIPEVFTYINGKFRSEYGNDRVLIKVKSL